MKYINTIRYLRPVQIYGRIKYKYYKPAIKLSTSPCLRYVSDNWQTPSFRQQSLHGSFRFRFLNEEHSLHNADDWDNVQHSKLWRYNLHYFDDLTAFNAYERTELHRSLINKWIYENLPMRGTGWEPYPTSLRIVNWIKWALAGNAMLPEYLVSLTLQARWLSKRLEIHILGNHLFKNAKALIFAGLFFKGVEADKWLHTGLKLLDIEVCEQIKSDGGHFELSPMYHAIIVEDLLDLINADRAWPDRIPGQTISGWSKIVRKMIEWLNYMTHKDGGFSFFNDSVNGIAPSYYELCAYADRLGIEYKTNSNSVNYLRDSGYIRVTKGPLTGILDVAPIGPDYLPGHAHADTLSFELDLYEHRVFVNSGISQYGNDNIRQLQRSTRSHNTVVVDGEDSSEVWSGFRVARRAYPENCKIDVVENKIHVTCAHNGYKRLKGKCIHERNWMFSDNECCVTDKVSGTYQLATARYYFHPDVIIKESINNPDLFYLTLKTGEKIKVSIVGADNIILNDTTWHPEFGKSIKNKCISASFSKHEIKTKISW